MLQTYKYKAKNPEGEVMTGFVQAASTDAAARILVQNALKPIDISVPKSILDYISFRKKVSLKDRSMLARQLSTMINAGLPLVQAISIILKQTQNKKLLSVLTAILHDVEAGYSFSTALSKHPDVFNRVFVNAVRAGEATGKLEEVLLQLADTMEKDQMLSSKIKGAMFYPGFILLAMIGVSVFLMIKVIPTLTEIFEESGAELPWTTKSLIWMSKFMIARWYFVVLIAVVLIVAIRMFSQSPRGMYIISKIQIKLPIIKVMSQQAIMARFARILGMLSGSGVPLVEAIRIVAESIPNQIYRNDVEHLASEVERGVPMSVPISKNPDFPVLVGQMVSVGEQTGKMSEVLVKLAIFYENETEERVKGMSSLIEPVIMIIIGIGVAIIVFAILLPIYQISQMQS